MDSSLKSSWRRVARADASNKGPATLCWLAVLIGATSAIDLPLGMRLTLGEALALVVTPFLLISTRIHFTKRHLFVTILFTAAIFAVAFSDYVNCAPLDLAARGLARPMMLAAWTAFFAALLAARRDAAVYLVLGSIGAGLSQFFLHSEFGVEASQDLETYEGFVFRIEPLITTSVLALAVITFNRRPWVAPALCAAAGVFVLTCGGSRGSGVIWMLSAAVLAVIALRRIGRRFLPKVDRVQITVLLLLALTSAWGVYRFYIWAAPAGLLGERQVSKFQAQQNTVFGDSPLGFFLAGRPQVFGAVLAIADEPLVGFGSWRFDRTSTYVAQAIYQAGDPDQIRSVGRGATIKGAGHSIILQAWVENGIIPALCMTCLLGIVATVTYRSFWKTEQITPYLTHIGIGLMWDALFSPLSVAGRMAIGLFVALWIVSAVPPGRGSRGSPTAVLRPEKRRIGNE